MEERVTEPMLCHADGIKLLYWVFWPVLGNILRVSVEL